MADQEASNKLGRLSNQELMELIDAQLELPDDQFDEALFTAAEDLLRKRAPLPAEGRIDPEDSWEEFQQRHQELFSADSESGPAEVAAPAKRMRRTGRFSALRVVAVAAMLVLLVNAAAALATGMNPLQPAIDLGETLLRIISYGPTGKLELPEGTEGYRSLEEAFQATGAEKAMQLTWVPSEFGLTNVRTAEGEDGVQQYWAYFESVSGNSILYQIRELYPETISYHTEKNPGSETVRIDGIEFDIVKNNERMQATWTVDSYTYLLVGDVTMEQLRTMVKSLK